LARDTDLSDFEIGVLCALVFLTAATEMVQQVPASEPMKIILLALQFFQVLFLWLHDWIPLRRLNDVASVRSQDTTLHLVAVTLIQSVPFTIGMWFSLLYLDRPYPHWLYMWLCISYAVIFTGQLRTWWVPYLFHPEPKRAARYQIMFGKTHRLLPIRNELVPNTAHVMFHLATAATLITLAMT
jgi:hypothetical protein